MAYKIERFDVWCGSVADRPGGLADKLEALSNAGASLFFLDAGRREGSEGIMYVAPVKGAAQVKAAKQAGLARTDDIHALRIEGPDKRALGATVACALGNAGISFRGLTAAAIGRKAVLLLALDTKSDATKAKQILAKAL